MTNRLLTICTRLATLVVVSAAPAAAQPQATPFANATNWGAFSALLGAAGDRMEAALPERLRADPRIVADADRLLIAATARYAVDAIVGDRRYPVFVPEIGLAFNIFQPNADTVYKSAMIDAAGTYRLHGTRGSVLFFKLGQLADMVRSGRPSGALAYNDFDDLKRDAQGGFDVVLSAERPKGYTGDWWKLEPSTEKLMLRQISYRWGTEIEPRISIDRLDTPAGKPRASAADLNARLAELPKLVATAATFFVDHVEQLRRDGYINKLKVFDLSNMTGLVGQSYYEGAYDLGENEALVIEAKIPEPCRYWSVILTNPIYQTTDWYNNQSSLNGSQAGVDKDGSFRIVISAKDPGVPNWLDTAGYPQGAVQGRWLACAAAPTPIVRKVTLEKLRALLPPETPTVTPAQREAAIRDRRAAVQQRALW